MQSVRSELKRNPRSPQLGDSTGYGNYIAPNVIAADGNWHHVASPTFGTCSNFVVVPPGKCVTISSTTPRPPAFNNSGKIACYRIHVQSLGNDDTTNFACDGLLVDPSPLPH